jgi:Uma2 family endonuclease
MNEIIRPPAVPHATTQAADGLPRLKWTLGEFERLAELGFFGGVDGPRERVELIDGELVPMAAKGARHEWVRGELQNYLAGRLPAGLRLFNEPGWRPGGELYVEPEIIICKAGFRPSSVPPSEVLVLIEVADTSIRYDRGLKARVYANIGVPEYWSVDANSLETRVHREAAAEGYGLTDDVASHQSLSAVRLPQLSFRLADLKLDE